MAELYCPSCESRIDITSPSAQVHCYTCGSSMLRSDSQEATTGHVGDNRLLDDLREAFGYDVTLRDKTRRVSISASSDDHAWTSRHTLHALSVGSKLGDFEIIREIGHGGMGVVYRARQLTLNREVALKVLPDYARHGRQAVRRFRNEARAAARLNHANVVPVYAQGDFEGHYFYAMKLVEGASLDQIIKAQPQRLSSTHAAQHSSSLNMSPFAIPQRTMKEELPTADAAHPSDDDINHDAEISHRTKEDYRYIASLLAGVADGLDHAHKHGVIHRDIKPHNIILGDDLQMYITDFGLAHLTSEPHMTLSGEIMGTPSYLSPEQAGGSTSEIDHRTDIYSLGVTLFELVTGERPFIGETRDQIIQAVCHQEATPLRRNIQSIPRDLETICLRTMEKDPQRRYPTASALAEDLRRFAEGRPILSRHVTFVERGAKWIRRHKAASLAMAVSVALLAVSTGWVASYSLSQQREADLILDGAYDWLVHSNYRKPEVVLDDIQQAQDMGASMAKLLFVQSLVDAGQGHPDRTIEKLNTLLDANPEHIEALYMKAWALWQQRQFDQSRSVVAFAATLGGPITPEAWFFRALAIHYDDPDSAAHSYQVARNMAGANNQYFPQASLNVARAYNQILFARRSLDAFQEAEPVLLQLVKDSFYAGTAHYLLSITYRLAAEIYRDTGNADKADEYFQTALSWAQQGELAAPLDNRPPTAVATCLEKLGKLEDAIAARDRAESLAVHDRQRCEGYYYRWRLHYWLGHLDEALTDIQQHAACDAEDPFFTHIYPALIDAERGDLTAAQARIEALANRQPYTASDSILAAAGYRLLGMEDAATTLLISHQNQVSFLSDPSIPIYDQWQRSLYDYCAGTQPFEVLLTLAQSSETPWKFLGEAYYHAGLKALASGDRVEAIKKFEQTRKSFDDTADFRYNGGLVLRRLKADPTWPGWIAP